MTRKLRQERRTENRERGASCFAVFRDFVGLVVQNPVAGGMAAPEITADYPYLEPKDIREVLQYAARFADA